MSIIRGPRPDGNFYILDKKISEDKRLSWAGRGLLVYLLGKPNHWQVSVQALVNEIKASPKPTGRDATWSLLRELIEAGYCTRHQVRKADGTLGEMDYTISEDSSLHPLTDSPCTAYPCTGEPCTANPTQVSIDLQQGLKKKPVLREKAQAPSFVLPDWINKAHWDTWHSSPKRKKATDEQKQLAVETLAEWRAEGIDFAGALKNAAIGGWQGLFKPDDKKPAAMTTSNRRTPPADNFNESAYGQGGKL